MRNSLLIITGTAGVLVCSLASVNRPFATNTPTPLALNYPGYFGNRLFIPAGNPTTVEGVALGRRLFYETRLSANNRLSCATNSNTVNGSQLGLTSREKKDLIAFLQMLTDSTFITDKRFSDPFLNK